MPTRKKSKKKLSKVGKMNSLTDFEPVVKVKVVPSKPLTQPAWVQNPVRFLNDKTRFVYEMKTVQNLQNNEVVDELPYEESSASSEDVFPV